MNANVLRAKALGFTNAISNLSMDERRQQPSQTLGEDYNKLLNYVREVCPSIAELLPPMTTFSNNRHGDAYCEQTYGEIYTYCEQLYQMIDALNE